MYRKGRPSADRAALAMQSDIKVRCRHAYPEHLRGRLLHFKLSFDGGRGRSRRTIGNAALPYASVLPDAPPPSWPQGSRESFPFSIPLYYGCVPLIAGLRLQGWSLVGSR
jgi:hypothetical protein